MTRIVGTKLTQKGISSLKKTKIIIEFYIFY